MDGITNLLGRKTVTREFLGRPFTFSLKVLADHAEKEQYILSLKPSPLSVLERLPANATAVLRDTIITKAVEQAAKPAIVTRIEELHFDQSLHGLAWSMWRALRDSHEDFGKLKPGENIAYETNNVGYSLTPVQGVAKAFEFIEAVGDKRHSELVDLQNGIEDPPELKNSSGSEPTKQTPGQDTDDSPGHSSSET